jgi:hypothetical protein
MASTRSYFETMINLKENNNNFGTIIFRKSCADHLGSKMLHVKTISTKMKWIVTILIILGVCSCNNEHEKMSHSINLDKDQEVEQVKRDKDQITSENSENEIILGYIQDKLENADPKVKYLKSCIDTKNINKVHKTGKSDEVEYFTTYLGELKLKGLKTNVFKQYYSVQAAIEKHGHSVIIFTNDLGATYYDMEMIENLPLDMINGSFRYIRNSDTLIMKIDRVSEKDLILRNTLNAQ